MQEAVSFSRGFWPPLITRAWRCIHHRTSDWVRLCSLQRPLSLFRILVSLAFRTLLSCTWDFGDAAHGPASQDSRADPEGLLHAGFETFDECGSPVVISCCHPPKNIVRWRVATRPWGAEQPPICVWTTRSERQWGEGIATSCRAIFVYPPAETEQSDGRRRDLTIRVRRLMSQVAQSQADKPFRFLSRSAMHTDFPTPPRASSTASLPPHATATFSMRAARLRPHFKHKQSNNGPWDV